MTKQLTFFAIILLVSGASLCQAELLMSTHGYWSFAPYVNGIKKTEGLYPGYRAEFMAHIDFVRFNNLIFTGIVGNKTMISKSQLSVFELDRIRYILSPGFRYEFDKWIFLGSLNHESTYAISRAEEYKGATWMNSIRIGAGTKGAYYLYLRDHYKNIHKTFLNSWDAQINAGVFLHGSNSIWVAKNHDYKFEEFSLVRYYLGSFQKWVCFAGLNQNLWLGIDNSVEKKINITLNLFKEGTVNFFGFLYTYTIYDTYSKDNENKLGAFGVRVIF